MLSDKAMSHLWKRMVHIYGHKWDSLLGRCVDENGRLSDAAVTWQQGLVGVSLEQVRQGFDALLLKNYGWPPSLPEFRELCLGSCLHAPSLEEAVTVLVNSSGKTGSLVDRFRHPLILAISAEVDMYALRRAQMKSALAMIRPVYRRLQSAGWPDWPEHAQDIPLAIEHEQPVNLELGRQSITRLREVLRHGGQALG